MSIRTRIALWIAATTAILLGGAAIALYQHLDRSMVRAVDSSLRSRGDDLSSLVSATSARDLVLDRRRLAESDESYVLVRDSAGRTLAESGRPDAMVSAIARPDELPRHGRLRSVHVGDDSMRVLELPVSTADGREVALLIGEALDQHDDALAALRTALMAGVPLVAALLVGAALVQLRRPLQAIERVRGQAAAFSAAGVEGAGSTGMERIDVPDGNDEITRLARTVNEMLDRIDHAVGQQRRFVASASHELRTPLAILKAELEAAAAMPPEAAHEAIGALDDEVDRLSLIADALLVVAEQDRSALRAERTLVDVAALAETVAERYRDRARRADRAIVMAGGAPGEHEMHADRVLLEQALANLIDNALRHGAGTIHLAVERRGGRMALTVADEGVGIGADVAAAGFAPFTRGAGAGARGSGLGLSIVRAIAAAHGGDVVFEASSDGRPARFATVLLPDAPVER